MKSGFSTSWHTMVMFAALMIILAGIKAASPIVVPFILSAFIAIVCTPLIHWLDQYKIPKMISILLIVTGIVLTGIWIGSLISAAIQSFMDKMPLYQEQLLGDLEGGLLYMEQHNLAIPVDDILAYFDPGHSMTLMKNFIAGLGNVMTNSFLILLTVIFMLYESPNFAEKVHLALDDPKMRMKHIDGFLTAVKQYMAIKTLVSILTGCLIGLGTWIIGVDYPVLWGVLAFFLNFIPNIGSIFAAIPTLLIALIQLGLSGVVMVGILYLVVNIFVGSFLEPKYMGQELGLSTLIVFLSLVFWGWMLGSVGMLLSVPLTMIIKIALESSKNGKRIAILMSS
jgi:AI-2 transport protein TqsA